jgi:hypothetical protein
MANHHVWHPWQWLYHVISRLENEWNAWKMVGILFRTQSVSGKLVSDSGDEKGTFCHDDEVVGLPRT